MDSPEKKGSAAGSFLPFRFSSPAICDAGDVSATVRFAAERGLPVAARGSGSGLAGECLSHGIVIDFTRYMNSVISVDAAGSSAQVEAGCVFQSLNDELAGCGKQFGPDPASGNRARTV